jgi:hypothetical protein
MPEQARRRRRRLKPWLVAGTSLLLGLLLVEGALRFLLFSSLAREWGLGWKLRNEALFTPREAGRETWKLRALLNERGLPGRNPAFDPRFGWQRDDVDPATFAKPAEAGVGDRRVVLLFGDSYAQCVPESEVCWEQLLEESELAPRFALLNYGVGGFGLDQVHMLLEPVLERFQDKDPLVVIGILVDDDLDRSDLAFRGYPKPYYTLEDGALVLHPLAHEDARGYLRDDPLRIRSYLWRWFLFGSGLVSRRTAVGFTADAEHVARKQALNHRILVDIRDQLARRGLDGFVVLFHARRALEAPGLYAWQEPFLLRTLAELGLPYVSSKRCLTEALARGAVRIDELYLPAGRGVNHYTRKAVEIVFEALRAGLEGRFEPAR